MLKADSDATVVIRMLNTSEAITDSAGHRFLLFFQKSKISKFKKYLNSSGDSSKYWSNEDFSFWLSSDLFKKSFKT